MSSDRFEHMLRDHPEWTDALNAILAMIRKAGRSAPADPHLLAQQLNFPLQDVIGYLQVLSQAGVGDFKLRLVDDRGLEVARYDNVGQVPRVVEDEFGDEVYPSPENLELVFVPHPA
jgi:hypothetical protein